MGNRSKAHSAGSFGKKQFIQVVTQERREKEVLEVIKGVPTPVLKMQMVDVPHIVGVVRPGKFREKRYRGGVTFKRKGHRTLNVTNESLTRALKPQPAKKAGIMGAIKNVFQRRGEG